jgi:malate:Na+ symporter
MRQSQQFSRCARSRVVDERPESQILRVQTFGLETVGLLVLPAYAVHRHWIPDELLMRLRWNFERADLLGIFICVIIVGSLLSLDTRILLNVLSRIWIVLLISSGVAAILGVLSGTLLGLPPALTLLEVIVPMMAGGITAGALPLAAALADLEGSTRAAELATLLPAVVVGNMLAVLVSGVLSPWSRPAGGSIAPPTTTVSPPDLVSDQRPSARLLVLGALSLSAFYGLGMVSSLFFKIPSPLAILALTAVVHIVLPLPAAITRSIVYLYRVCIRLFTYPLLLAVGLLLTPWQTLVDGLHWDKLIVAIVTIAALTVSGAWIARFARLTFVEGALIGLARAAMGGSGDIAILSAARRMDLMPFAQIATRLGGALTVALTLALVTLLRR